jgi:hypothetical protein
MQVEQFVFNLYLDRRKKLIFQAPVGVCHSSTIHSLLAMTSVADDDASILERQRQLEVKMRRRSHEMTANMLLLSLFAVGTVDILLTGWSIYTAVDPTYIELQYVMMFCGLLKVAPEILVQFFERFHHVSSYSLSVIYVSTLANLCCPLFYLFVATQATLLPTSFFHIWVRVTLFVFMYLPLTSIALVALVCVIMRIVHRNE